MDRCPKKTLIVTFRFRNIEFIEGLSFSPPASLETQRTQRGIFSIAADPREIGYAFHRAGRTAMENHSVPLKRGSDRVIQCFDVSSSTATEIIVQ